MEHIKIAFLLVVSLVKDLTSKV